MNLTNNSVNPVVLTGNTTQPALAVVATAPVVEEKFSDDEIMAFLFGVDHRSFTVDKLPEKGKEGHAVFKNGLFKVFENTLGRFVTPVKTNIKNDEFFYLENTGAKLFEMYLPKIPVGILNATYNLFSEVAKRSNDEVMVQIFWNKSSEKYELYVPYQEVAGASISFARDEGPMVDPNLFWAMDIHSHVYMSNFFSGVDSRDEISSRLYGVIGHLNKPGLSMSLRAGSGGEFFELKYDDVFDNSDPTEYEVSEEDNAKIVPRSTPGFVSKFPAPVPVYSGARNTYYGSNKSFPKTGGHHNYGYGPDNYGFGDYDEDFYLGAWSGKNNKSAQKAGGNKYPATKYTQISRLDNLGELPNILSDQQLMRSDFSDIAILLDEMSQSHGFMAGDSTSDLMIAMSQNLLTSLSAFESDQSNMNVGEGPNADYIAESIVESFELTSLTYDQLQDIATSLQAAIGSKLEEMSRDPSAYGPKNVKVADVFDFEGLFNFNQNK